MTTELLPLPNETSAHVGVPLNDLRLGRRLKSVTTSIESFLQNQLLKLETAMDQCAKVEQQNEMLKRMFAEFEKNKRDWEKHRLLEEQRLYEAGQKLVRGWEQLDVEKSKLGLG